MSIVSLGVLSIPANIAAVPLYWLSNPPKPWQLLQIGTPLACSIFPQRRMLVSLEVPMSMSSAFLQHSSEEGTSSSSSPLGFLVLHLFQTRRDRAGLETNPAPFLTAGTGC